MAVTKLLFFWLCFSQVSRIFCQNVTEVRSTFELLEKGRRQMELTNQSDVVLVFGGTASGKSTFVQWITSHNTNLISMETYPGSGEFRIEDRIGSSTASKPFFPKLVVDVSTGTVFYDFPEFSDMRSPSYDIAATFLKKSVLDHVESVKMLFVASYNTVQYGADGTGFTELLKNIDDLIKDVKKFKDSIALVVSNVDNTYLNVDGKTTLKSDPIVIEEIADFLRKTRKGFEDELRRRNISSEQRRFSTNAIKIIDILLTKENGKYTRISLFRRPNEQGLLSAITLLVEGRAIVQRMISDNLLFTRTDPNDFGFTISHDAKLKVDDLVALINDKLTSSIIGIAKVVAKHLESFMEPVLDKMDTRNLATLTLEEARAFTTQANTGHRVLSEAKGYFSQLSQIGLLGQTVAKYLSELGIEVPESFVKDSLMFSKYVEFFQLFRENPLPVPSLMFEKFFQPSLDYLTGSLNYIKYVASSWAEKVNSQITSHVDSIVENVKANFKDDFDRMVAVIGSLTNSSDTVEANLLVAQAFHQKLLNAEKLLKQLVKSVKVLETPQKLHDEISKTLRSLNLVLPSDMLTNLVEKTQKFEILETVSATSFDFSSTQWSQTFERVIAYIESSNIWFQHSVVQHTEEKIASKVAFLLVPLAERVRGIVGEKPLELEVEKVDQEIENLFWLFFKIRDGFEPEGLLHHLISDEKRLRGYSKSLNEQENHLRFLNILRGKGSDVSTPKWKALTTDLFEYLDAQLHYSGFVVALYDALSQYSVQSDVSRYNVLDLSDWGKPGRPQGIHVDRNNFEVFMEKVGTFNIEAANKVRNLIPSDAQLAVLNNVLMVTLQSRVETQCPSSSNSTVVVRANFVKISDLLDNRILTACGRETAAALEVYALNALFIDGDLEAPGVKLSIVAPRWDTIGSRRFISLNGRNGEPLPKAANGSFPGDHGQNGLPGLPGGSAGAFFGVVSSFADSENLIILANGGHGGPGQSGGSGANGEDGQDPPLTDQMRSSCDESEYTDNGFQTEIGRTVNCNRNEHCRDTTIFGTTGGKGGNSGSCGVGGWTGSPGEISVLSLTEKSKELRVATSTLKGADGISGSEGLGGRHGNDLIVSCSRIRNNARSVFAMSAYRSIARSSSASNGNPSHGCNPNNPVIPLPGATFRNPYRLLRGFVRFFIENSNQTFVRIPAQRIFEQINSHPETAALQDTIGLIEDLKMLVNFPRPNNLNLIPFYETHLTNIEKYAENPRTSENSDEFRKVLAYLYTASLTEMSNLRNNLDSDLIIDISGYLDMVLKNIRTMQVLQDESHLVNVVNSLMNDFNRELVMRIEEANRLIEDVITPMFAKIAVQFEAQMKALVEEVIELQNAAHRHRAELEARRRELQREMRRSIFRRVLNTIARVCALFGPKGQAVGAAIRVGTTVSSSISNRRIQPMPPAEFKGLKDFGNEMLDFSRSLRVDRSNIRDVTRAIEDVDRLIEELEDFENRIYEELIPLIERMAMDLIAIANNMESQSSVTLDVTGWQVQRTLRSVSLEIERFTRGFEVHDSVVRSVEKLEEVMTMLITIYDRIQEYQEQKRLAVYMAELNTAGVRQIIVSNPLVSNSFRNLQIAIQSNIVLNQYNAVLNAFKQWIFPFAARHLSGFQLPPNLVSSNAGIQEMASTAASRIEFIRSRIRQYQTTITQFDQHIFEAQFNRNSQVVRPFYVWGNEEFRDPITRLLSGETVLFRADVVNSATTRDAIKFNFIELGFNATDRQIQSQLDGLLNNFGISMTHLGHSYYRFNGQYFLIVSSSQTIHYSFERLANGERSFRNNVYRKLQAGDIMLSPYTMWEIKLTVHKPGKTFSSLQKFADKVELLLEGRGSFVQSNRVNIDVLSYYELANPISLLDG